LLVSVTRQPVVKNREDLVCAAVICEVDEIVRA
jgi:hypothetical protein